jgi:hypothetical protein
MARRRDLYQQTHNTHKRQTSMPPAGFKPAIAASERPQTHPLDRAATRVGNSDIHKCIFMLEQKNYHAAEEILTAPITVRTTKLTIVIPEAQYLYQLHTELLQTFFC